MEEATNHRMFAMPFARVYPLYVAKAERKGRSKKEVDQVIRWLTGYTQKGLEAQLKKRTDKLIDELAKGKAMEKILRTQ